MLSLILAAVIAQASPTPASTPVPLNSMDIPSDGKWHYSVTPYIWAPTLNGEFQIQRNSFIPGAPPILATIATRIGPSSYLTHINFAAMFTLEARKDAGFAALDTVWLNLSGSDATIVNVSGPHGKIEFPVSTSTSYHLSGLMETGTFGGAVAHNDDSQLDLFAMARFFNMNTNVSWNFTGPLDLLPISGNAARNTQLSDLGAGMRGKVRLVGRLYIPFYLDGGYGNSQNTVQAIAGLGYNESWGNWSLVWRTLDFNTRESFGDQHLNMSGIALAARINL